MSNSLRSNRLVCTLVGALFSAAIDIPLNGSTFTGIVVMTTFCTAGAALLLWLPLFYLIGAFVLRLVFWKNSNQKVHGVEQAVVEYVSKAKQAGLPKTEIKKKLLAAGWSEDQIKPHV